MASPPPPTTSSRRPSPPTPSCCGQLEGIDGAHLIASILVVEARQAAVLADLERARRRLRRDVRERRRAPVRRRDQRRLTVTETNETPDERRGRFGRRQLLVTGGATLSLGALLAACGGSSGAEEPGRVGYAPVPTALPIETSTTRSTCARRSRSSRRSSTCTARSPTAARSTGTDAELLARLVESHTEAADAGRRARHRGRRRAVRVRQRSGTWSASSRRSSSTSTATRTRTSRRATTRPATCSP